MKRIAMTPFINDVVEKLDWHRNAFDVCRRREQVDLFGKRRRRSHSASVSIDRIKCLQQLFIHSTAVEQRVYLGRSLAHSLLRLFVVQQLLDTTFVEPQILESIDLRIICQGLGQKDPIYPVCGSSGNDIHLKLGADQNHRCRHTTNWQSSKDSLCVSDY